MNQAQMVLVVDGLSFLPLGLLAESLERNLIDLGLSCFDGRLADNVVSPDLVLTASASNDVVVLGRLVGINELFAPALGAAK